MAGLQVNVYVSVGITWTAALVALSLRMLARQMTRMKWWLDDYFAILALVRSRRSPIINGSLTIYPCTALRDGVLRYSDRM